MQISVPPLTPIERTQGGQISTGLDTQAKFQRRIAEYDAAQEAAHQMWETTGQADLRFYNVFKRRLGSFQYAIDGMSVEDCTIIRENLHIELFAEIDRFIYNLEPEG